MPTITELQAQYDRLQEAIAQTPPEHCGGLHYASGLLVIEIKNHPAPEAHQYKSGDVVCLTCKVVIKNNPAIIGVSHGYCGPCGAAALAEAEAWIAKQTTKMLNEFTQAKAAFAAQVNEAV